MRPSALREAAIGAGDHVLAADQPGEAHDAVGDQAGCSTVVRWWVITPGIRILPSGSLLPSQTRHSCSWRGFAASTSRRRPDLEDQVDQLLHRRVGDVWHVPAAEADVITDPLLRDAFQGVVERLDAQLRPLTIVFGARLNQVVVHVGEHRIVDLHDQAGLDDRADTRFAGVCDRDRYTRGRWGSTR